MKTINIPLEEKEYKTLKKNKGKRTWREFILDINGGGRKNEENRSRN